MSRPEDCAAAPGPFTISATQTYGYDYANRLSAAGECNQASGCSFNWSQTYVYDMVGNQALLAGSSVLAWALTPQTSSTSAVPYNDSNHWLGVSYNAAGSMTGLSTQTFTYDAEQRLIQQADSLPPATSVSFTYDGDGRRVTKTTGSMTTTYVYDAAGNLAAEYDGAAAPGAGTQYLTTDHLGSVRLVTDATGAVVGCHDYLPFGVEIPQGWGRTGVGCYGAADTTLRFTGKERDAETGLDYFGERYMSSAQGRFTSPDFTAPGSDPFPVPGADFDNPQSLNLYSYVRNNPLASMDPDGHDCVVQTRTSDTTENVSVTSGDCDKINVGDGQTNTYIAGTVDFGSIASNGSGGITFGFTPYSGGGGVADLKAAPVPDYTGIAVGWGNNAQGYQQIAAAGRFINTTGAVYGLAFGAVAGAAVAGEVATATAATRSGVIFRLAHGMRLASSHSVVVAQEGAIKNAIAAAITSGAIQKLGGSAFQGVVNVAGTFIRFTGAFTPSGIVVSNVMGAALRK